MRSLALRALAVTAALGGLVGCSDADDAGTARGSTLVAITAFPEQLDRPGYLAGLNAVCTTPEMGGDIGEPVGASSSVDDVDRRYDAIETRLELMRELPVPAGEEDDVDRIVQAYDRVLTALDELSTAIADDDSQSAILVETALDGLRATANELTTAYGVGDCAL
jgi:hypothetical protein